MSVMDSSQLHTQSRDTKDEAVVTECGWSVGEREVKIMGFIQKQPHTVFC